MDIAAIKDLVGSVGFPGAMVLYLMYMGRQLLPVVERFVTSFETLTNEVKEIREDIKVLTQRLPVN